MEVAFFYLLTCAVEAVIAWYYFNQLFAAKKKNSFVYSSFLLGYSILWGVSLFHQLFINVLAFFAINSLLLFINFCATKRQAILHVMFLTSTMIATEMIWMWGTQSFGFDFAAAISDSAQIVGLSVPSKLLYLVIVVICAQLFSTNEQESVYPKMTFFLCALPVLSIGVSYIAASVGISAGYSAPVQKLLMLIVVILLLVNLLFVILYHQMQRLHAQQLRLQLSLQQEQADLAYYQALQEQSENQHILIHDIKNHLQSVHALAQSSNDKAVTTYVETILKDMTSTQPSRLCTDSILNLVLLRAQTQCKTKHIDFQCDVRDNCLASMDAPSITTLYGNLLSNAIEAAEQSIEKAIELSVTKRPEQRQVVISITNSCEKAPVSDGMGGFISCKKDGKVHGIGLKSIQRIVKRYHGESITYYDTTAKQFHHILQFPME